MLREKIYELRNWKQVVHMTWIPEDSEGLRIHLMPPRFSWVHRAPVIVLLNGQEMLPLKEGWAILLTEFMKQIRTHGPQTVTEADLQQILQRTFQGVRQVYPEVRDERLQEDLAVMMETFEAVLTGKTPKIEIGNLSITEYAPYMRAPHRVDLMLSAMTKEGHWNCNQKCLHCYAAGQTLSDTEELSTGEWKEILAACKKAGVTQVTFTGGEPTLRKDLCELVAEAGWFVTRLNTNGILLTEELCRRLKEAQLDNVQITLYSADPKIHNRLVGADGFQATAAGIKNAIAAGLNVSINTPLCRWNREYLETLKLAKALGVTYVTCSGLIVTGKATADVSKSTQLPEAELLGILEQASAFCKESGMGLAFTSPGWIAPEKLLRLGIDVPSCGACLSNMAVAPDGSVIPCQSWLSGESFGKMQRDPWKKIWDHRECKKQRKQSAGRKLVCPLREREEKKGE